jgi:hypothetical protein
MWASFLNTFTLHIPSDHTLHKHSCCTRLSHQHYSLTSYQDINCTCHFTSQLFPYSGLIWNDLHLPSIGQATLFWVHSCRVNHSFIHCPSHQSSWLQIQRSGFDSQHYQIFREVVGLEWAPLSVVSTIVELLERKSSSSSLENRVYGHRGSTALTTRHPFICKS